MGFIKSTIDNALQHSSIKRILLSSAVAMVMGTVAFNFNATSEQADAASGYFTCKSPNTGETLNLSSDKFKPSAIILNGNQAAGVYKHPGQCSGQFVKIGIAVYYGPADITNPNTFSQQKLVDHKYTTHQQPKENWMTPVLSFDSSCFYQIDMFVSGVYRSQAEADAAPANAIPQFTNGHGSVNTYTGQNRMVSAVSGGQKDCVTPPPAPAPAAPASVNNVCVTNSCNTTTVNQTNNNNTEISNSPNATVNTEQGNAAAISNGGNSEAEVDQEIEVTQTVTNNDKKKNKVTTKQKVTASSDDSEITVTSGGKGESPKELPNTGPGLVAAIGFGTTFMSSFLYSARSRYAEMLAKLIARF